MNKFTSYLSIALSIALFIFNYEYFFVNAEGIFIISFLLFSVGFYFLAGDMIGDLLDTTTQEISQKIKEVSKIQKQTLTENKKLIDGLKKTQARILPLFVLTVYMIEKREELLITLQEKSYKNFLEKKLKEVLIESTTVNSDFSAKAGKEIMDLYEKKIKKK